MPVPGMPFYQHERLAADGAVFAVPGRIMALEVSDVATDVTLIFYNAASATGTPVLECSGAAEQGGFPRDYTSVGGVPFSSKCYLDLTGGAGIVVHVWWEPLS